MTFMNAREQREHHNMVEEAYWRRKVAEQKQRKRMERIARIKRLENIKFTGMVTVGVICWGFTVWRGMEIMLGQ